MKHTPTNQHYAPRRIAKIIMNGREKIDTEYGRKTIEGITDLIERETNFSDLLEFIKNARDIALSGDKDELSAELVGDFCKKLIAKIEGKEGER